MERIGSGMVGLVVGAVLGGLVVNGLRPDPHAWMVVGVMAAGGLLGGGVNYVIARADDPYEASLLTSLALGLGAALLVPLFLHVLSSDLLKTTRDEPLSVLVFLGFCLIAGISSRAFITTISDRILRKVEEVEEKAARAEQKVEMARQATEAVKSDVEELVDSLTETETEAEAPPGVQASDFEAADTVSESEQRVLEALYSSRYAHRSAGGMSSETRLSREAVLDVLDELQRRGLVTTKAGKKGHPVWSLTGAGRAYVNSHRAAHWLDAETKSRSL